ncbi:MAG: hypothetical protein AAFQ61_13435 [Cyanobacteria bacterium J06626_23]
MPPQNSSPRNEARGAALGTALILGLHFIAFFVVLFTSIALVQLLVASNDFDRQQYWGLSAVVFAFTGVSIYQLPYVIPLALRAKRRGHRGFFKGIVITAAVTGLISGPCFLIAFAGGL